jgi:hypothetical protein
VFGAEGPGAMLVTVLSCTCYTFVSIYVLSGRNPGHVRVREVVEIVT